MTDEQEALREQAIDDEDAEQRYAESKGHAEPCAYTIKATVEERLDHYDHWQDDDDCDTRERWYASSIAEACAMTGVSADGRAWACARPAGHVARAFAEGLPTSWHAGRDDAGRPVRLVGD